MHTIRGASPPPWKTLFASPVFAPSLYCWLERISTRGEATTSLDLARISMSTLSTRPSLSRRVAKLVSSI